MAKLIVNTGATRLEVDIDEELYKRLAKFERERWRNNREAAIESWRTMVPEIFNIFLKSKGY